MGLWKLIVVVPTPDLLWSSTTRTPPSELSRGAASQRYTLREEAQVVKRFLIVIPLSDGGIQSHPMKEWLRQNPEKNPTGLDPTLSTSHQLRNALKKHGWRVMERTTEVWLIPPEHADWVPPNEDGEEPEVLFDASFTLEYQLRDFIAANLSNIEINGRRLNIYVDPAGREGIEYQSPAGVIDILGVDETGALYVFELKRGRTPDVAIGQLARYMGWVKQTIGKTREVYGVIVAKTIGDSLRYAASVIPGVGLFEYEVKFRLKPAELLPTRSAAG